MCIGGLHPPQANRGSYYCSNKHLSAEGIGRSKIVREKKGEQTQKKRKNTKDSWWPYLEGQVLHHANFKIYWTWLEIHAR